MQKIKKLEHELKDILKRGIADAIAGDVLGRMQAGILIQSKLKELDKVAAEIETENAINK